MEKAISKDEILIRLLDKESLRKLLGYGDIKEIAKRVPQHYQTVSRIIRNGKENDQIWQAVVDYLEDLPSKSIKARLKPAVSVKKFKKAI